MNPLNLSKYWVRPSFFIPKTPHSYAILLLIGLLFQWGCVARETRVERGNREQHLHIGNSAEPQDLDPHSVTGALEYRIITSLFEGLTSADPKALSPAPGVAERWEISPNQKTYTFYLRSSAKWSNGLELTAQDFVYSFKRILSPKLAAEYAYMLYVIQYAEAFHQGEIEDFDKVGVKALDNKTLVLHLNHPVPYFLSLLNHYAWFPIHPPTIQKFGKIHDRGTDWTRPGNLVGNGPFQLIEWKLNQVITVERNPHYWDRDKVKLNAINFYPIESAETEERAFRAGQLHLTSTVPLSKIEVYKRKNPQHIRTAPFLGTYFYRINVAHAPLDNKWVRKALAACIEREEIVELILKGGQSPAYHFVPKGLGTYASDYDISGNIKTAKKWLAEAGFPNGDGFPEIEILYNTSEAHKTIAQAIQQMWNKHLNIRVKLLNQEWKVFLETQQRQDYTISRAGWIGDYLDPNTFLDMFLTKGGNNLTGWSNREYDRCILEAARTSGSETRLELLQRAEAILLDEVPIVPIYFYTSVYLIAPSVQGWHANVLDHHPYKYVHLTPDNS